MQISYGGIITWVVFFGDEEELDALEELNTAERAETHVEKNTVETWHWNI